MADSLPTRISHQLIEWKTEWMARRNGRKHLSSDLHRATRDIVGPTGWGDSKGWDQLSERGSAYIKSFDRDRIPPSLHVSERDRIRAGEVMPLQERCIEDFNANEADKPRQWSTKDLAAPQSADNND